MRSCLLRSRQLDGLKPTDYDEPRRLSNYPQRGDQQLQTSLFAVRSHTFHHKSGIKLLSIRDKSVRVRTSHHLVLTPTKVS